MAMCKRRRLGVCQKKGHRSAAVAFFFDCSLVSRAVLTNACAKTQHQLIVNVITYFAQGTLNHAIVGLFVGLSLFSRSTLGFVLVLATGDRRNQHGCALWVDESNR